MGITPLDGQPAGIYLHIPFCASLCPYCDFAVYVRKHLPHEAYTDAVLAELDARIDEGELEGRTISTLYLGGGTPSLLQKEQLGRILDRLHDIAPGRLECTIEANPIHVDDETIAFWKAHGVTRVSLGLQSFDDTYLKRLGRRHSGKHGLQVVEKLIESPLNLSIDFIFAGPDHTPQRWQNDLAVLSTLTDLDHLSAYHLTIEPNTRFAQLLKADQLPLPDDEIAADMLLELRETCAVIGLEQYEVSSYAKQGRESLHNTQYWIGAEYLGVGVGAHGLQINENIIRTSNDRHLRNYLSSPTQQRTIEEISPLTYLAERLFTGLRTRAGIQLSPLQQQFETTVGSENFAQVVTLMRDFEQEGLQKLVNRDGIPTFIPTSKGYLFADYAAQKVFEKLL